MTRPNSCSNKNSVESSLCLRINSFPHGSVFCLCWLHRICVNTWCRRFTEKTRKFPKGKDRLSSVRSFNIYSQVLLLYSKQSPYINHHSNVKMWLFFFLSSFPGPIFLFCFPVSYELVLQSLFGRVLTHAAISLYFVNELRCDLSRIDF